MCFGKGKAGKAAHSELSQSGRKVLPVMQQERESPVKTNRRGSLELGIQPERGDCIVAVRTRVRADLEQLRVCSSFRTPGKHHQRPKRNRWASRFVRPRK